MTRQTDMHELFGSSAKIFGALLDRSHPLREGAAQLGVFLRRFVPLHTLVLIRLTVQGGCKETGAWCADHSVDAQQLCDDLRGCLDACTAQFASGLPFDDAFIHTQLRDAEKSSGCRFALIPLAHDGHLRGFALLGRAPQSGRWNADPLDWRLYQILRDVLGLSFAYSGAYEDSTVQSWVFNAVMDSMKSNIYVTDTQTDRILFMNRTMKETFGIDQPEGQVCWQVLQQGMSGRCAFCPVGRLLANQEQNPSYRWEEHSTYNGRTYENYDCLMRWLDGSTVHFQQSVDVTDTKALSRAAYIDELTELRNRRAGKAAMETTLARAARDGIVTCVAMLDINFLKEVNDQYGHSEGDALLARFARILSKELEKGGYPFRLSGDEFVAVFENCTETAAAEMLGKIGKSLLDQTPDDGKRYEASFCYGLVELPPGSTLGISEILRKADERMYQSKRRFHHDHPYPGGPAAARRAHTPAEEAFEYDSAYLYDALVESTDDYLYLCNMHTGIFRFSPAMVEEFGLPGVIVPDAIPIWGAMLHPHDQEDFFQAMQDMADGRTDIHNVEYRVKNVRGEWVWLRCRGHLQRDAQGSPTLFAGLITNLGRKNKVDHLTGLFNKFVFESAATGLIEKQAAFGMLVLGLDDFKRVNDLYDREFGDEVIRITAQKLQSFVPENATVYRLDGDEFAVLAPDAGHKELGALYSQLCKQFQSQQHFNGKKYYCTLSAGCCVCPVDGMDYFSLFKYASYALEYAKAQGKNRIAFFSANLLDEKSRALDLTEQLRASVENDFSGFSLHYQPQVCIRIGQSVGAEALARWQCEKYGAVPPAEFIPLLEESGLILPVGRWVFSKAVADCTEFVKKDPRFTVSINLSFLQLIEPGFFDFMRQTLAEAKLDPAHIVVELTESHIVAGVHTLRQIFSQIRSLGVRIAMDDFGTGYSSLEILKNSPADIVKIDRAFVRDILTSSFDATFIRFIVALCHDVGIAVCLEGVETEQELSAVEQMQLDYIQGFYFSKPLAKAQFAERFLDGRTLHLPQGTRKDEALS